VDDSDLNLLVKKLKNNLEQSEPEEINENIAKEQSYDFLPKLFKNDD